MNIAMLTHQEKTAIYHACKDSGEIVDLTNVATITDETAVKVVKALRAFLQRGNTTAPALIDINHISNAIKKFERKLGAVVS